MSGDEVFLQVVGTLRERVRSDPYRTLAMAAVLGLAGGAQLWGLLGSSLLRTGARFAIAAVVPQLFGQLKAGGSNGRQGESHA